MHQVPFWRVCRILANRPRLKLLALINRRPGLRVSELAKAMKLSRPAASQYLRALEACHFISARRVRRSIAYELSQSGSHPPLPMLRKTLVPQLCDKSAVEPAFKLATAFANLGRIEVFRALNSGARSIAELRSLTGFAKRTLWRHIQKLQSRGFVRRSSKGTSYVKATPKDEFGRTLATAAAS